MLTKYFDEEFQKIKSIIKDFSMANEILSLKYNKNYATPGHDDMKTNAYSNMINFLSYSYKSSFAPTPFPINHNSHYNTAGSYPSESLADHPNYTRERHNYMSLALENKSNKRSVVSVGYNRRPDPMLISNNTGKVDIEKRIRLENLKKHLSTRFERETAPMQTTPYNRDIRSQIQSQIARFSSHTSGKPNRSYKPMSAIKQRRTTTAPINKNYNRVKTNDYGNNRNKNNMFPSTLQSKLNSNKSGPINPSKYSRKKNRDKASYEYFISIANQSISKQYRENSDFAPEQPKRIMNEYEDEMNSNANHVFDDQSEPRDKELDDKMRSYKDNIAEQNIGQVVNHMDKAHQDYNQSLQK